jgi:hypothetical protein
VIGYPISRLDLESRIHAVNATWLARASARTQHLIAAGRYQEQSSIWSEIKPIYMELQGDSKCAFCERKLESVTYGRAEQAVEHFRPKGRVTPWRATSALKSQGVRVAKPPRKKGGYYLLAYDLFNYAACCHPCNSALKRDYFPVAAAHNLNGSTPEALLAEQPLLIYPIGDFDDPPESLIQFLGLSPQACATSGYPYHRALTTIEFFQLDGLSRKNLIRERAMIILALFPALEKLQSDAPAQEKRFAITIVKGYTSRSAPHTNCARSFKRLFETGNEEARAIFALAAKLVESAS